MGSFNDNFNRSDQALSTAGDWPVLGGFTDCAIVSNQATISTNAACMNYWNFALRGNQFTQATIGTVPTTGVLRLSVCITANGNDGYSLTISSSIIQLLKVAGGSGNSLGFVSVAVNAGDIIRLQNSSGSISVLRNSISVISATDLAYPYGQSFAAMGASNTGSGTWETWTGGDDVTVRDGVFSKDRVLYVGSFDAGILPNYGLFDDDFVDQSDGTTVGATATGMGIVNPGMFDRRQTLMGLYGAS